MHAQTASPAGAAALDRAVRAFHEADSAGTAAEADRQVVASGASFEAVVAALEAGRSYTSQPSGAVDLPSTVRGIRLDNLLDVPAGYEPSRRYPLRVSLHGGVGRAAPGPHDAAPRPLSNRIPSARSELVLHPRAWADTEWWTAGQVENIVALVERVKRAYNVDESRTYVTGISDGGTGVYFLAMRAATPWAACLPLNGHPSVLANPATGADGELFAKNIANCPVRAVNGGRDRLYPAASVRPVIEMFTRGGIPVEWQVYPEANHDTSWWPEERERFDTFVAAHPRVAHPGSITWETERTDRYNRFRWLLIDRLGSRVVRCIACRRQQVRTERRQRACAFQPRPAVRPSRCHAQVERLRAAHARCPASDPAPVASRR